MTRIQLSFRRRRDSKLACDDCRDVISLQTVIYTRCDERGSQESIIQIDLELQRPAEEHSKDYIPYLNSLQRENVHFSQNANS